MPVIFGAMKFYAVRISFLLMTLPVSAFAANNVVNLSHYDLMRPDFVAMKSEGILGVIHEASYPRLERDAYYQGRQAAAARAGLLWGAYHFGDATDPVRQADHFLRVVGSSLSLSPNGVLLVLDFEKNGHYPGGTMRVDQAVAFVERIRERTGKYPGVYMSEYRIRQMLGNSSVSAAHKRIMTNCWLWVANYHFEPRNTWPWSRWALWQYTGDGKCDLPRFTHPKSVANIKKAERNIFSGSDAGLIAFWQEHAWQPQGQQ
jgi:lysozyme